MNFSTIEDSVLEEKKKFNNFLSRFFKNSRILIILLIAAVITAVSVSIWIKEPEYQILYSHLSNEDSEAIINQLNQIKAPYQFNDISGQILVPKNKIYEIRLHLAENNLPHGEGVGFELLDREKFGISQFNEQINYQRALEGELARTIQRINVVKSARIHIAFPKSSLFLQQDKKKPSASVVLEIQPGRVLDTGQINAILHLISSSVSNLSVENITIVDQLGKLLNQSSLRYDQINDFQLKYSENIESRYKNRIKSILEPLVGVGKVHAQVTAQIDFNSQEKTQEKYSPNSNSTNKSIRSHQMSIHKQTQQQDLEKPMSFLDQDINLNNNLSKNLDDFKKNKLFPNKGKLQKNFNSSVPINSDINRDDRVNYELNHSISHIKMNIGEIKRLSAAVIIDFIKDKNGKPIPLTTEKIHNIENLIREAIGYSKSRGDSIHLVNASFSKDINNKVPVQLKNNLNSFEYSHILYILAPWILASLFLFLLLKNYICPFSKSNIIKKQIIKNEDEYLENKNHIKEKNSQINLENDSKTDDKIIHQICNISNQNPRTIALIIRKWMSDKI